MVLKKGSKGPDVLKFQKGLVSLGYALTPDGDFGSKTEDKADDFQADHPECGAPDGIVGKGTLAVYNKLVAPEFQILATVPTEPTAPEHQNSWVTVPCHVGAGGFSTTTLRDDAAQSFKALYTEVCQLGGMLTSAGGKRPLSQGGGAAQSLTSMHYLGRAHDMSMGSAMKNPKTDPVVVERQSKTNRKWTLWMRTSNLSVPIVSLVGIQCSTVNGKTILKETPITGRFFNFTDLAAKHGWVGISARKSFFNGGSFSGAEFWHLQWTQGLVTGQTTFGTELLRLYSPAECKKLKWWDDVKDAVYGDDFN